ncbi:hypothetical protein CCACVL1_03770 [Corchorus capsularis]|uniref:Uncharacterized protein n=1 Tax=Corchorus capsularis TaxID=210143 RepID=A0A1R3JXE5_COCAP|nr:hypothetical protein CCACVL1_03770 [Corchorus capsularis]
MTLSHLAAFIVNKRHYIVVFMGHNRRYLDGGVLLAKRRKNPDICYNGASRSEV